MTQDKTTRQGTEIAVRYWNDEEGNQIKTRSEQGFETIYSYGGKPVHSADALMERTNNTFDVNALCALN